jgi:hypothetical protein
MIWEVFAERDQQPAPAQRHFPNDGTALPIASLDNLKRESRGSSWCDHAVPVHARLQSTKRRRCPALVDDREGRVAGLWIGAPDAHHQKYRRPESIAQDRL